ncbi:sorting nexin-6 isoform X1 [Parasteatoda tepidariorum]|uniref:Sorting nexin n=1 Tax=Parasteatoda tepidariorum TaxID=114398 RepID=A0A2L2Y5K4_PARTP|nr:sorting nexin-6 isoform X1 [Parasteatoda tepidariorum]
MLNLQDGTEDSVLTGSDSAKNRSDTVDLSDQSLVVDISDALSERDKVKFTVHTKTTLPVFAKPDFSVVRQHEEFVWLHNSFEENEKYAGFTIPPAPPCPDFDASREKLHKLSEGEGTMTKEEFLKMKQELEMEYLATFKKTVAMHEVFLQRLACHPIFRNDSNLKVFLEYEEDLNVRGKNKREILSDLFSNLGKSADDLLLSTTQKDVDEFFEHERSFLIDYHSHIKNATARADKMTQSHKSVADTYIKISSSLVQLATIDGSELEKYSILTKQPTDKSMHKQNEKLIDYSLNMLRFFSKVSDTFEKARKVEGRVATDEDLKLSDTLRYYMRDTAAAKNLLYRRLRCLANYEAANRNLEKARAKNKDVHLAETAQQEACDRFEAISKQAKQELQDFKIRRVAAFKRNLVELAELEIKHAKAQAQLLKNCLLSLKEESL